VAVELLAANLKVQKLSATSADTNRSSKINAMKVMFSIMTSMLRQHAALKDGGMFPRPTDA
jgi:hypothetical protein